MVNGKGKASPPDRRMWLMALKINEITGVVMPSLLPEISNKSRPQAQSVIERGREVPSESDRELRVRPGRTRDHGVA
jgi:hypothetical protein